MSSKKADHYFLRGGGEMGELTRAKDWSKTSLGDPAEWPQSLRITLGILLNSKFPMFLWWGNELTCFYNDAYRPSLGKDGKHPSILGMPAKEAWTEIWDIIKPLIDKVVNEREAVWFEDMLVPIYRNGKIEDVYWTFSYSPVIDDTVNVVGVLVTCTETTEKVNALRKIEESNQRFRNTMKQAPVGITILRGPQFMVEMANDAYLQLIDKKESDFVGNPLFASLPEVEEVVHSLLDSVLNTGVPYHGNEVPVPINRYGKQDLCYFDFLYHPLKEDDGTISGIIVAVIEVTEKVEERRKVEESDEKLKSLIENAPFPIGVYAGKEMRIELANESIIKAWGKGNDVKGKLFKEILPEVESQQVFDQLDEVFTSGIPFHAYNRYINIMIDGKEQPYFYNYSFTPVFDSSGKVYGVMNTASDVTDLNLAKKKIEESEQDLRSMVLQAPIGICILDAESLVCEIVNDSFIQIAGKPREAILGKYYWDTFAEAKPYYESALNTVVTEGKTFFANETELMLIHNGKEKILFVTFVYAPLKNEEGNVKKVAVWVLDNTQQVMARRKIEEDTEKLNIVIDASELGTWELNLKTKEPTYSKRYLEILGGYKEDVKLNHSQLIKHLHPEDLPVREKAFKDALETGYLHYQARLIWNDNSIHWMEGKGKVFYDQDNKPVKLIGTIRDITEEKNHEEELKKSEEQFKILADQAPMWVWLTDKDVNVIYTNPEVLKFLGISHYAEFTGNMWEEKVHPEDISMVYKSFSDAASFQQSFSFEFRVLNAMNQQYEWFYIKAVPRLEAGECTGFIGTGININEQKAFAKELELQVRERTKELETSNTELEKMNRELQSFAYISSHDLQEPLRKIQTFASRIKEKEQNNLSDSGKDMFNRMQEAAKRMQTLIQDLLAYSRTNITEQKIETTNLNEIIAEVKDDLKEELKEKHATIEATHLCDVNIIPFQFRQLMHNLIGNSLKFSDPDNPPHIKIKSEIGKGIKFDNEKLSPQQKYCHISVSDNGIGFDQQYSEKIFEVFQRLHGKNEYNGTGIGLSIVKKIVENHNGIITAKGEQNKGATFDIYIPAS